MTVFQQEGIETTPGIELLAAVLYSSRRRRPKQEKEEQAKKERAFNYICRAGHFAGWLAGRGLLIVDC